METSAILNILTKYTGDKVGQKVKFLDILIGCEAQEGAEKTISIHIKWITIH